MLVIGLTGGIGTGKSEVGRILLNNGAAIIDADLIGHEIYVAGSQGWTEIVAKFGDEILDSDSAIDRKILGNLVFDDRESLQSLNDIVHPKMYNVVRQKIEEMRNAKKLTTVIEGYGLIEAGWLDLVDELWVTVAREDVVVSRLKTRDALSEQSILERINAQMSQDQRVSYADVVIENSGDLNELKKQVHHCWEIRIGNR